MNGNGHAERQAAFGTPSNPRGMHTDRTFEAAWREMKPRIERLLYSRGVAGDVVDDVTQETGIKLLSHWSRVDPSRPLWPLARTIATNCLVDQFRQSTPEPVAEVPDGPAGYDVEEHGLARARLGVVARTIRSLRPADRSVLLAEIGEGASAGGGSAQKMARLRARRRLSEALERSAAAFAGVPLTVRRMATWLQGSPGGESYVTALTGAAVAATIAVATVAPQSPHTSRPHEVRKAGLESAVGARAEVHRPERGPNAGSERPRDATPGADVAQAADAPQEAPDPTPAPAPSPAKETKVAEAGGKTAKTGGDDRYRYVVVCAEDGGPADRDVTVTYGDEGSYEEASQDHCD